MNAIEKLMSVNVDDFSKVEKKDVEVKGLSKKFGEPFIVTIKQIDGESYMDITTSVIDKKGNPDYSKTFDMQCRLVMEGVCEPNLKDKDLLKHFGVATPKQLVKKLFTGSDLTDLAGEITDLSGFGGDADEEVKN